MFIYSSKFFKQAYVMIAPIISELLHKKINNSNNQKGKPCAFSNSCTWKIMVKGIKYQKAKLVDLSLSKSR